MLFYATLPAFLHCIRLKIPFYANLHYCANVLVCALNVALSLVLRFFGKIFANFMHIVCVTITII